MSDQQHVRQLPSFGLLLAFVHLSLLPTLPLSGLYPHLVLIHRVVVYGMLYCQVLKSKSGSNLI